jgi:restriction system protein
MAFEDVGRGADDFFVNRETELAWIANHINDRSRWERSIAISGPGGIGKTTLVQQFIRVSPHHRAAWLNAEDRRFDFDRLDYMLREKAPSIVVLDYAELHKENVDQLIDRIFNWKAVRGLLCLQKNPIDHNRIAHLRLGPLDRRATEQLFANLLGTHSSTVAPLIDVVEGHPLAIRLTASVLRTGSYDPETLATLLKGPIYDLERNVLVPRRELVASVRPKLILVNERVLERLKAKPTNIHQISPRQFEELIAELLSDMNFDVELTPPTRDGGRDVLAYWNSPVGRLLCLVEAKKHRPDRPVGVQLVRSLYGTLVDEHATSAMLVTTSDFSSDARKFEQRHKWQLSLRNYTDLVKWIDNYKKPKPPNLP